MLCSPVCICLRTGRFNLRTAILMPSHWILKCYPSELGGPLYIYPPIFPCRTSQAARFITGGKEEQATWEDGEQGQDWGRGRGRLWYQDLEDKVRCTRVPCSSFFSAPGTGPTSSSSTVIAVLLVFPFYG